jgi:hypothetical protein
MVRNLKVLGLAAAALFAVNALVASGAQAAKLSTESGGSTVIEADQVEGGHVFSVEGNNVTCTTAHFVSVAKGTNTTTAVANGATEVTVHPTYTGCTAFGIVGATVTTTGCNYTITAPGSISEPAMEVAAKLNLECSGTNKIIIDANGFGAHCTATVASQAVESGLKYINTTETPMTVMLNANEAPVVTDITLDEGLCPFEKAKTGVIGEYTGNTTAEGVSTGITVVN